jgi:hypothetical protein
MTELCDLAVKYATDKCVWYTEFYHSLLKNRRNIKKVLEFGIGDEEDIRHSLSRVGMVPKMLGPSLHMWAEYFPEAEIYALDHDSKKFVQTDRIHSFYCDQGDPNSYRAVYDKIGENFDLIIEDGSHHSPHQIMSVHMLMPLLLQDGIYVMEDTGWGPNESILQACEPYHYEVRYFSKKEWPEEAASVVVIRKK